MELNFNSVETIANLNASAAFQVDSGKVFKEDTDIAPVIIDKSLSCIPLGGDNEMPYNLLNLIEGAKPFDLSWLAWTIVAALVVVFMVVIWLEYENIDKKK